MTVPFFGLFLASLRYPEPRRSRLTSMVELVTAVVVAWVWLDEQMTLMQTLDNAAVLGGVLLLQMESVMIARKDKPTEG